MNNVQSAGSRNLSYTWSNDRTVLKSTDLAGDEAHGLVDPAADELPEGGIGSISLGGLACAQALYSPCTDGQPGDSPGVTGSELSKLRSKHSNIRKKSADPNGSSA